MKDYRLLTDRKIYMIVYKEIKKIAPLCVDNKEGMNNEQKNQFVIQIMKKLNVNKEQALFLLKYKSGNYRNKLLQIDSINEKKTLNSVINYLEISKHNLPFILFLLFSLLSALLIVEVAMIINKELFVSVVFGILIVLLCAVILFLIFKLINKKNKYESLLYDNILEEDINISKIKLQLVSQFSNHPPHIVWIKSLKVIGVNSNNSKIKLIYPMDIMICDRFDSSVRRKFNKEIKKYYRNCYFVYMKNSRYILESKINFKHITEKITKQIILIDNRFISLLFDVDISRISRHIKDALSEEKIDLQRNLRKTQIANSDKLVYLYDLDVIISVGYRVKSNKAFR